MSDSCPERAAKGDGLDELADSADSVCQIENGALPLELADSVCPIAGYARWNCLHCRRVRAAMQLTPSLDNRSESESNSFAPYLARSRPLCSYSRI